MTVEPADKLAQFRIKRRKRRVLMVTRNPVPFDRHVWQQASALYDHGYQITIICITGHGYDKHNEVLNGINFYRYALPCEGRNILGRAINHAASLVAGFALALWVKTHEGFDLIHAHNPPDSIFLIGAFFKFFYGTKFLFDHHDAKPELYEAQSGHRGLLHRFYLWQERLNFNMADISIAANASYRRIAIERGGMQPDKVFIVRTAPDLNRFKITQAVDAQKRGRAHLVAYAGIIGKREGIALFIDAIHHIIYDLHRTDIHFTLVGSGLSLEEFEDLAEAQQIDQHVTFTGSAPEQVFLEILNSADLGVNPAEANASNDIATIGNVVDYMALGKPVLQFELAEGRASASDASLYAKANDTRDFALKIIGLIDSPQKRAIMGSAGRARVERSLAWSYEAPKLLAAYNAVFSEE